MKKKILVIEDDDCVRDNLKLLLEAEDYYVCLADNGKDGINKALNEKPDLIICDIIMPDIDGLGVLEVINYNELLSPFIFLTAKNDYSDMRKGMELGADDYITKPYDADELLKAIDVRLQKHEMIKIMNNKNEEKTDKQHKGKIYVRIKNNTISINIYDVVYLSANRQYSTIYTSNKQKYIIKKSLNQWEEELSSRLFFRIHRATIVNQKFIKEIKKNSDGSFVIILNNSDEVLDVSRRYYKLLRSKLSII